MLWQKRASTDRKLLKPDWETPQQHHTETSSWRNVRKHAGSLAFHHKLLHRGNPAKENLRNCNTVCVSTICLLGPLIKEEGTSLLKWWLISGPSLRNCRTADLKLLLALFSFLPKLTWLGWVTLPTFDKALDTSSRITSSVLAVKEAKWPFGQINAVEDF